MKKKILTLAAIAICGSIAAGGTLAYFNASDEVHNVITSGGVTINLVEKMNPSPGTAFEDFEGLPDFEDITGVMPGASISKMVAVQNTGANDAWIRVWVKTGISEQGNPLENPTIKCLPLEVTKPDGSTELAIDYDFNTKDWYHGEDGYYYYREPVPALERDAEGKIIKGMTETLFETVTFSKYMGNEYQNCQVIIDVTADAIQYDNNPLEGEDYAGLWPDE